MIEGGKNKIDKGIMKSWQKGCLTGVVFAIILIVIIEIPFHFSLLK